MTKMVRVGVTWTLVTFAGVPVSSIPNHLYVVPFTLILPVHPMIDRVPCTLFSGHVTFSIEEHDTHR